MNLDVIHEDNHLVAVHKPAGLLVQGDSSGDPCLLDGVRDYLRERYAKPGNVFVGLVHRLDRNVSGVVLLARTSKAASRLSTQFRRGEVEKVYRAICEGCPPAAEDRWCAWLAAAADSRGCTRAATEPFAGARESILEYRILAKEPTCSLVEVVPTTGRRHQIRVQFSLAGCPLLGDVKYGASRRLPEHRIALHALRLQVAHPVGGRTLVLETAPPVDWPWPPTARK